MKPAFTARTLHGLTVEALQCRLDNRYARHPIQNVLDTLRALYGGHGEEGDGVLRFQSAEGIHRAGAQGLPLSENPQFPQNTAGLSRLSVLDKAGRRNLRLWAESLDAALNGELFLQNWQAQGKPGGVEHHVFYDADSGRWFKRLHHCIHGTSLGDYFDRMRLHAVLFPETACRLEGFTIHPKNRETAPVISQPHVEVDTESPPVSGPETDALMARMGFEPVRLKHNGVEDDGYCAYLHRQTGVLAWDLHDENVVRMRHTGELAVIDPCISLVRRGTWAALKLAEVGIPAPPDDPLPSL